MTIGIYALNFNGFYYIGKSNNIERRTYDHLVALIKNDTKNANYKLLNAYKEFGIPKILILECCNINDLGIKEIQWIKKFNSIQEGLNITSGGDGGGSGTEHNRSIHSKDTIIKVFQLLLDNNVYTYTEISKQTGVSISTITEIVSTTRHSHIWLKEEFPDLYDKLQNPELIKSRKLKAREECYSKLRGVSKTSFKYPSIISPEGEIYNNITNAKQFAETHNLSPAGLCRLFSGKLNSHHNWKLYKS